MANLMVQTPRWFQSLVLRPEDLAGWCAPLARAAVDVVRTIRTALDPDEAASVVLLSASAGRLPGLVPSLEADIEEELAEQAGDSDEDFGAALVEDGCAWSAGVHVLGPDAAAMAALHMAAQVLRGDVRCGHLNTAPPPSRLPPDAGPPRLHFRGRDHLLSGACFTLGRHPDCNLVFDSEEYPGVSARHCEIVYDRRAYFLRDRSRNGTLVNDCRVNQQVALHSGDWIRLGASGPLLRFLGRAADQLKLITTA
jgi:hypothetical protein